MDETINVIFKVQFDFALEVWFIIFATIKICDQDMMYIYH